MGEYLPSLQQISGVVLLSWALIEVLIVHWLIGFLLRLLDKDLIGVGSVVGVGKRRGGRGRGIGEGGGYFLLVRSPAVHTIYRYAESIIFRVICELHKACN